MLLRHVSSYVTSVISNPGLMTTWTCVKNEHNFACHLLLPAFWKSPDNPIILRLHIRVTIKGRKNSIYCTNEA